MEYRLQDLVDTAQFQSLQDRLNEIYPFPSAIIDNKGNVLTATAWQDICTQFHRRNKECEKECIKSDQYIVEHLAEANPAVRYRCPHGLIDNAMPIIVDGKHLGNYFVGQFFLEPPDLEYFKTQAAKYDFDEESYLAAVRKVPVWTMEKLDSYLHFLKGMIGVVSNVGLKSLKAEEVARNITESEERHKTIFQAAMDGFWLVNTQGNFLEVNEAYCQMSGYSAVELLSMRITDIEAAETPIDTARRMQKLVAEGGARFESTHRRKDGSVYDVEVSARAPATGGGLVVVSIRDITERKRAEEQLKNLSQRLLLATSSAQLGVWDWNVRENTMVWNERMFELYGVAQAGFCNNIDAWMNGLHPEDREAAIAACEAALKGQKEFDAEFRICQPDGTVKHLRANGLVLRGSDGSPDRMIGVNADITGRKQAEKTLRESESMLREAQTVGRIGSYVFDIPGNAWSSSAMLDAIFGIEAVGTHDLAFWTQIVHPDEREQMASYFRRIVAEHAPFDKEYRIVRVSDGAERWVWGLGKVEYHADGTLSRMVGSIQDITERKQAEKEKAVLETQFQHAQKMDSVGRLAGGVAHDFNNMLTVILGNVAMAIEHADPTKPLYTDLVEIRNAATRSADLTRQLLAFARKQVIAPRILNLNETVSGIISMLRRLIGEDINLEWLPGADLWPVKIDPSQLDQILANLCINARDAIAGGGNIAIETRNSTFDENYCADHAGFLPGQYVCISVSDNGHGIDKETLAHIFEPFFTTKSTGEGTGLGLATVYGTVKQSNGFINVYSELSRGTTFTIYLPRHEGQGEAEVLTEAAAPLVRGQETVLLVEDEPSILKLTERILARRGYAVVPAETPGEAIRLAAVHPSAIHLLITDVVMPEMNGRDLASELQARYPSLKVLFMSGYPANIIVHQGVLDQGVHFIQKPFAVEDLAAKVREVLDSQ